MADMQNYNTVSQRVTVRAAVKMLKEVENIEILGPFGMAEQQPLNTTDTIVWRRLNPWNMGANGAPVIDVNSFELQEGVNPPANSISYTDVSATLQHYGLLFKFSKKTKLMYADDVSGDMVRLTARTLSEQVELLRFGVLKGGTVVDYSNGTSRAAVNTRINISQLRRIARTLEEARAMRVTSMLAPGPKYDTKAVEPCYLVFHHTDLNADIRDLPDFTRVERYGTANKVHPREIGACEEFRFIPSPLFRPFLAAGASVGSSGMKSVGASNVDVYPFVVMGEDAWGHVALKGNGAIKPVVHEATPSKADPLGQFGYVGANYFTTAVRLNENWMCRGECGASDLA